MREEKRDERNKRKKRNELRRLAPVRIYDFSVIAASLLTSRDIAFHDNGNVVHSEKYESSLIDNVYRGPRIDQFLFGRRFSARNPHYCTLNYSTNNYTYIYIIGVRVTQLCSYNTSSLKLRLSSIDKRSFLII